MTVPQIVEYIICDGTSCKKIKLRYWLNQTRADGDWITTVTWAQIRAKRRIRSFSIQTSKHLDEKVGVKCYGGNYPIHLAFKGKAR